MKVRQGTFSTLPELTDDEIRAQIQYGIDNGWAVSIEYTDDPHPRNVYWDMWGMPMFDLKDAAGGLFEVNKCREAFPNSYVKVSLYNAKLTKQTIALQFMVQRPKHEPGFRLVRSEANDRRIQYTLESYAANDPHGDRYAD
ncbi:MAG TPA: ribulose bisphosphate carboxylase small subunit [Actinomycetota bacterium]|nr:ribulose bisphosphate carboxylase small subunit [Actinomycetota bacterium]